MEKLGLILANILEMVINNYSDEIAYAVMSLAVAVIGFLLSYVKNSYVKSALESVEKAVVIIGQTVVDDLKAKSADGKLTDDEKEEVKANAIRISKQQMGIVGTFILNIITGSADKWISTQVEYIVAKIKTASNSKNN